MEEIKELRAEIERLKGDALDFKRVYEETLRENVRLRAEKQMILQSSVQRISQAQDDVATLDRAFSRMKLEGMKLLESQLLDDPQKRELLLEKFQSLFPPQVVGKS